MKYPVAPLMNRMRATTLFLAAALAVATSSATLAGDPPAAGDSVAEAIRLAGESKAFERTAGDSEADVSERKAARRQAYERLVKAVAIFDEFLDKHPNYEERFEKQYCDLTTRLYWVKKMAAADEFSDAPLPTRTPPAKTPSAPAVPTAADAVRDIEEYAAKHRGDVPGVYERWQEFLAKFPNPATPEYAKAMAAVASLGAQLKDAYRLIHDDDPDSVKNLDGAQTQKLYEQLVADLEKGPIEVRERAARFLGALGSGKAADPLLKALKREKSGQVYDAAADSLAKIGGRRVCDRLLATGHDEDLAPAVVDILQKILARGGAEGRVAGEALGGYVGFIDVDKRSLVFDELVAAGPAGAVGIARGAEFHPSVVTAAELLFALPDKNEPRVVVYLAKYLVADPASPRAGLAQVSARVVEQIGKPAVRHLIPNLDDPAVAATTADLLHKITGEKPKDDKRKTWEAWFKANRKALEAK